MRILHTADIHAGAFPRSRLRSACVDALNELCELALTEGVEVFVVAGDLFESPRVESHEVLRGICRALRRLCREGVDVVCVPGSHDLTPGGLGMLTILEDLDVVKIPPYEEGGGLLKLKPLEVRGVRFYGLPGLKNSRELEYLESGRVVFEGFDEDEGGVLVAHTGLEVSGFTLTEVSSRYREVKLSREALAHVPSFTYVALGHIHFPTPPVRGEVRANAMYPGSPIGRDANDILETHKLRRRYGTDRRALLVDLDHEPPRVKPLISDFNVGVEVITVDDPSEAASQASRALKDMEQKYRCLIVVAQGEPGSVERRIAEVASRHGAWYHVVYKGSEEEVVLDVPVIDLACVEELELKAAEEVVRRLGLNVPASAVVELIRALGQEYPEGVAKESFDEEVVRDSLKVLEELVGGGASGR